MTKKYLKYAKLFTQEEVNEALKNYKVKQKVLAKKPVKQKRKGEGERRKNKGKIVLSRAAQLYHSSSIRK